LSDLRLNVFYPSGGYTDILERPVGARKFGPGD
jgi:hypothetical protein